MSVICILDCVVERNRNITSFLAFRIFVRIKLFGRIYADDVLVLVAWLMLFASVVIFQSQQTAMYNQFVLAWGTFIPTPEELKAEETFMHTEFAIITMYYTSLWSVKLSVLVFFRRLGQKFRGQKTWWWCVTSLTVATWATCIGSMPITCLVGSLDDIYGKTAYPYTEAVVLNSCSKMRRPISTETSVEKYELYLFSRRDHRCSQ